MSPFLSGRGYFVLRVLHCKIGDLCSITVDTVLGLLTLRDERRPRVFENRVLRRIFGPRRDEITRKWRKLHNKELNDLYSSPNIVRVTKSRIMRWLEHVAPMG